MANETSLAQRPRLTDRQRAVLSFIEGCIDEHGCPPTMREIGQALGIRSTNGVNDHLKALERKGYLQRQYLKSRALQPADAGPMVSVPVLGDVAAGVPLLAVEQVHETLKLDGALLGNRGEIFALRIKGDSMIEDGIHHGDYVFVRKQADAKKGDTVVAMIEGEATVKRFYPEGQRIRFQPANQHMEPIIVSAAEAKNVELLGVVIGVFRKL